MLNNILLIVQIIVSVALIALILIQQGKGADAGAAFGSGASATVFGARGSGSFLTRTTAILATIFFLNSLGLAYLSRHQSGPVSVVEQSATQNAPAVPAKPTVPTQPAGTTAPVQSANQPVSAPTAGAADKSKQSDLPPAEKDTKSGGKDGSG